MIKPAIVVIGYNRPRSIERLLWSINRAYYPYGDVKLIVSIDECDVSNEVEKAVSHVGWLHGDMQIIRYKSRQGLRQHVLQCGDLSKEYGAIIVLEDDLVVSPSFYIFAYQAINEYGLSERIAGVALYSHSWNGYAQQPFTPVRNEYDAYLGQFSITWGQCWTSKQWLSFRKWYSENEGKLPDQNPYIPKQISDWGKQSWGKYFVSYIVEKDLYYVIPYNALSTNFTEVGQHNPYINSAHQVPIQAGKKMEYCLPNYERAIKYDVFFERIFDEKECISGIQGNEILCDLYSTRTRLTGKKYLLSLDKHDAPVIASFGLSVRPVDANISLGIEGKEIYLYKIQEGGMRLTEQNGMEALTSYHLYDFTWRSLLSVGFKRLYRAFLRKIHR